ncbi:MAG: hypothetical protein IJ642_06390 [Oscillospiraceae bacterium]|nr:hypothetical protein [Oscillospiraceae bacterium]
MPDYKELYYESQAELADIEEKLKKMVLHIQMIMRKSEEKVISDGENSQKED